MVCHPTQLHYKGILYTWNINKVFLKGMGCESLSDNERDGGWNQN